MITFINNLFSNILSMSFTAGFVVLIVLAARLALKKSSKKYSYLLWGVVALRLIFPISITSKLSLFNLFGSGNVIKGATALSNVTVNGAEVKNITEAGAGNIGGLVDAAGNMNAAADVTGSMNAAGNLTGIAEGRLANIGETAVSAGQPRSIAELSHSVKPFLTSERAMTICSVLWIIGLATLIIYCTLKLIKLCRHLNRATRVEKNIYGIDGFSSPFIFGLVNPRIYLPYSYIDGPNEGDREMVIKHERCHLKRGDHYIKVLSFALLSIHWFNPLIWLAFYLYNKDMEMSCDEMVIEGMESTKEYSYALLKCASPSYFEAPLPVAFAESSITGRIKNIVAYRKRSKLATLLTLAFCLTVFAACATDASSAPDDGTRGSVIYEDAVKNPTEAEEIVEMSEEETAASEAVENEAASIENNENAESDLVDYLDIQAIDAEAILSEAEANVTTEKSPEYIKPVAEGVLSDTYGSRSNLQGETRQHNGVDFGCPVGSPVSALSEGRVVKAGWDVNNGFSIMIDQNDGYLVIYNHLSECKVQENDMVKEGDVVALSGNTGRVTGPCLHIAVIKSQIDENGKAKYYYVEPVFSEQE